jgi:predicted nucleic acid-binding Zn ribbon protein
LAERIVQHKHCPPCGKAMSAGKEFCSSECEEQHQQRQKERKKTLYYMYAAILIFIIFFVLQISAAF